MLGKLLDAVQYRVLSVSALLLITFFTSQVLLRTSSIQIKDLNSHVTIKPIVQRVLNLKSNPPVDDSEDD
ncbi:hypothetical protein F5X98DRAFT_264972 [Xylaria grammica]|nr:hypothetical protein F5X98DRAFT_264972 [Xylaria grammica]